MSRLVADVRLSAEILLTLRFVNRSACAASRIRDCFGCGGGGRLGDNLIFSSFFQIGKKKLLKNFHRILDFVLKRANLAKFNKRFEKGAVS